MRHTITVANVSEAMKNRIVLASSFSAKTGKGKRLEFRPWDLKYIVHPTGFDDEEYHSINDAIARYNDIDA